MHDGRASRGAWIDQAIADAQSFFERATTDLAGVQYQPEFDYWKTGDGQDG